ncbi:MAG: hypothetical protein ACE5NM_10060 [Sedimentisphaerales bacterium]
MAKTKFKPEKRRHRFFLNPYEDVAFTKCPKCHTKTLVRKFPLVIHIEPAQMLILNKTCKYCTKCDLIVARKSEVEALMTACFEDKNPEIIGNEYLVMGTLEKRDWRARDTMNEDPEETIKRMFVFKDVWNFEPMSTWYLAKK